MTVMIPEELTPFLKKELECDQDMQNLTRRDHIIKLLERGQQSGSFS
ncbi:MAG: hypothetical protein LBV40_04145 [Methanomicrobiales archaeon]|jgi:hypothetical protein|nr:hypothetical protein [Methanomicrobiales archaeon]